MVKSKRPLSVPGQYSPWHDRTLRNALRYYVEARISKAEEGQYPYFSEDREEQEQLDDIHQEIEHDLIRSENRLMRLLERRMGVK